MKTVVFLGPSLPLEEARQTLDATYLPPVRMGDVFAAVTDEKPDVIAIVDGYFESVPAVWHKEILYALSRGIAVTGASSMGALRAVEMATFGMQGVGWVYEAFRAGELEDDDEVAVLHGAAETGYKALSTAMVNLRFGLQQALQRELVDVQTHDTLVALAKKRLYTDRSWECLWSDAGKSGIASDRIGHLRDYVETEKPDVKRDDARLLLGQLKTAPPETGPGAVEFVPTCFWDRLTRDERKFKTGASTEVRAEELRRFAKATHRDLPALLSQSLLIHLAGQELERLGLQISREQINDAIRSFRQRNGLVSGQDMKAWLERSALDAEGFWAIMHQQARIEALLGVHASSVDEHFLEALALSGTMAEALAGKAAGEARVADLRPARQPDAADVERFYRTRVRPFSGSLREHARKLGFASKTELIDEIRKIYRPTDPPEE